MGTEHTSMSESVKQDGMRGNSMAINIKNWAEALKAPF